MIGRIPASAKHHHPALESSGIRHLTACLTLINVKLHNVSKHNSRKGLFMGIPAHNLRVLG